MKAKTSILAILLIIGCSTTETIHRTGSEIIFNLDISEPEDDLFHVTAYPPDLGSDNNIYNFVATAPGVYSVIDIGRLVKSFKVYNADGDESLSMRHSHCLAAGSSCRRLVLRHLLP